MVRSDGHAERTCPNLNAVVRPDLIKRQNGKRHRPAVVEAVALLFKRVAEIGAERIKVNGLCWRVHVAHYDDWHMSWQLADFPVQLAEGRTAVHRWTTKNISHDNIDRATANASRRDTEFRALIEFPERDRSRGRPCDQTHATGKPQRVMLRETVAPEILSAQWIFFGMMQMRFGEADDIRVPRSNLRDTASQPMFPLQTFHIPTLYSPPTASEEW